MPNKQLISLAKKSKITYEEVERIWKKSKKIVKKQYPHLDPKSPEFYRLVYGITKKIIESKKRKGKYS